MEEEKTKEPTDVEIELAEIIGNLYKPATMAHFDKTMNTVQLFNILQKLYPSDAYEADDIYDLLKQLGYNYHYLGEELEWLFIEK